MDRILETLSIRFGITNEILLLVAFGLGILLFFVSVSSSLAQGNPAAERIAKLRSGKIRARNDRGLLRETVETPGGLFTAALPSKEEERKRMQDNLIQAGLTHPNAFRVYILVRVWLGLFVPLTVAALIFVSKYPGTPLPSAVTGIFAPISQSNAIQIVGLLTAIGYFGPVLWLTNRQKERQRRIREAFPNALDLLQISIQSGMGFDAAMTRVGNELTVAAPDLAFEFLNTQHQIQAGRPREAALTEMVRRTGVDLIQSFSTVVQQSMRFGTSMSDALTTYASEMRDARETKAQEMANKLPVKMSAVLAALMLPTLMIVTAGPSLIRYFQNFGS